MSRALPRAEERDVPDIRETLAQLDRRLADLRHQIDDLADTPEPAPPPPPPARRDLPLPPPPDLGDHPATLPAATAAAPEAERARARALSEGIGQLGSQIEQLLTVRERLLADARQLVASYARALDDLEHQDISQARSALASLLSRPAPPLQEKEPATGADPGAGGRAGLSRPAFFEGMVNVSVTGATRIQTIQVLEDSLSRVRHVEQVYIRRWHAGQLWLEVTTSGGVDLIGELNRVLPFPFAVQSATAREIMISLDGER